MGRPPTDLDAVVDYREDNGERVAVTLLDRATQTLRLGGFTADVAARCGVRVETVREWERVGTAVLVQVNAGERHLSDLSPLERMAARFVTETAKAEAEGKMLLLGLAEQLSRGGASKTTETVKVDSGGRQIEKSTKVETTLPDSAMIRWRLERRWPEDFHPPSRVEVTGKGGAPVQFDVPVAVRSLYEELDRIRAADATVFTTPGGEPVVVNGNTPHPATPGG